MDRRRAPSSATRLVRSLIWLALIATGAISGLIWGAHEAAAAPVHQSGEEDTFYGRLQAGQPGCPGAGEAMLVFCDGAETLYVQAGPGSNLGRFFGQSVAIRGNLRECPSGARYIELNSIEPTQRCEPRATAEPPSANLALGAPVVANTHVQPHLMQHATDGDPSTYWYAPGRDAWIYLDLGPNIDPDGNGDPAAVTFNEARLYWGERYAVQYGIYVFNSVEGRWMRIHQKSDGGPDEHISFPRALGRYVLLQLARSSVAEGGFALREIELYGVQTPNLALGSQVTASSQAPGSPPWAAVDGDELSSWSSLPGDDLNPWIYARIPSGAALTEFRLLWDASAMPAVFRVGFYQSGEIQLWSQAFQSTNARQRLAWGMPIECDAFYVYTEALGPAGRVQLHELALYGPDAARPLMQDDPALAPEGRGYSPWLPLAPRLMEGLRLAPLADAGLLPGTRLGRDLAAAPLALAEAQSAAAPRVPSPPAPTFGPRAWPDPR